MQDPKLEQLVPPDLEKDWSVRMTLRLGRATSHFAQAVSHERNWVPKKFLEVEPEGSDVIEVEDDEMMDLLELNKTASNLFWLRKLSRTRQQALRTVC